MLAKFWFDLHLLLSYEGSVKAVLNLSFDIVHLFGNGLVELKEGIFVSIPNVFEEYVTVVLIEELKE